MACSEAPKKRMCILEDYRCLEVAGPDALVFLQGQVSSDLERLPPAGGQLSTFNDPQGRVIALLRIFRTDDGYLAALPEDLVETVGARLKLFVMRSKVAIEPAIHWRVLGGTGEAPAPTPDAPSMKLDVGEPLWIGLKTDADGTDKGAQDEWNALETAYGLPEIHAATSAHFVPQMLRLERFGAVSFTKGCYVGQEVIARAHHLGRIKRHTRLYRAATGAAPGDPVMKGADKVGEVARVANHAKGSLVLAVVRDDAEEPFTAGGANLTRLPDPPGFG